MCFPEGVQWTVVVLFGLSVEVDRHGLGDVVPVDGVHGESDWLTDNGSFVQCQEELDAFRGACGTSRRLEKTGHSINFNTSKEKKEVTSSQC